MNKNIYILLLAAILFMMNSCTERIELELDDTYTRLVVEGNLSTDTLKHTFYLTQTSSYYYNQIAPKVSGAIVSITDDLGNKTTLNEEQTGMYCTAENFFGVADRNYEFQIDLNKEIGGQKRYEAASSLPDVNPIDSIGMSLDMNFGKEGIWIVKLYATDPAGIQNYYMFNVYKNGVLMTDTLNKVSFVEDKLFDGNFTHGIGVVYFNNAYENQQFEIGDKVVLQMSGISKEYFTYMNEVIRATSFQNPMFGGPPANVSGNLSEGAFGYFPAYSNTYSSMVLTEYNIEYVE